MRMAESFARRSKQGKRSVLTALLALGRTRVPGLLSQLIVFCAFDDPHPVADPQPVAGALGSLSQRLRRSMPDRDRDSLSQRVRRGEVPGVSMPDRDRDRDSLSQRVRRGEVPGVSMPETSSDRYRDSLSQRVRRGEVPGVSMPDRVIRKKK
jgi:hypothetical protein